MYIGGGGVYETKTIICTKIKKHHPTIPKKSAIEEDS
jgi:hypothetical protein